MSAALPPARSAAFRHVEEADDGSQSSENRPSRGIERSDGTAQRAGDVPVPMRVAGPMAEAAKSTGLLRASRCEVGAGAPMGASLRQRASRRSPPLPPASGASTPSRRRPTRLRGTKQPPHLEREVSLPVDRVSLVSRTNVTLHHAVVLSTEQTRDDGIIVRCPIVRRGGLCSGWHPRRPWAGGSTCAVATDLVPVASRLLGSSSAADRSHACAGRHHAQQSACRSLVGAYTVDVALHAAETELQHGQNEPRSTSELASPCLQCCRWHSG
jgi:hypothetical protein